MIRNVIVEYKDTQWNTLDTPFILRNWPRIVSNFLIAFQIE
jgi:hypothetical protein